MDVAYSYRGRILRVVVSKEELDAVQGGEVLERMLLDLGQLHERTVYFDYDITKRSKSASVFRHEDGIKVRIGPRNSVDLARQRTVTGLYAEDDWSASVYVSLS